MALKIYHMLLLPGLLPAWQSAPPEARFEVASVRLNDTAACHGRWDFNAAHGMVNAQNAPLLRIVSRAFNLTDDRVSGPAWMESTCFDIKAKAPKGTPDRDLMPMLQALLTDRFHLLARRDSEPRPVYYLVPAKQGVRLLPYGAKIVVPPASGNGRVLLLVRHMPDLCERLGKATGRPVLNRTGLDGDYQIELSYLPPGAAIADAADAAADVFSAIQDQLGLKLEPARDAVEILKIESLDKTPSEN